MLKQLQEALCRQEEFDALLITSEANRRYATGFPSSAGVCLITRKNGWFFTDFRYIEAAQAKIRDFRIEQVKGGYAKMVNAACEADGVSCIGYEESALICSEYAEWEKLLHCPMVPMKELISDLRKVKSRWEADCCIEAQRIAERALEEVLNDIRPGVTERFLAARLTFLMLAYGGEKMSFDPIVVSGAKSSLPHGVPDDKPLEAGDFVVMDFGCTRGGYCSDMTRTVAVSHYTDEMAQVYQIVLDAQRAGIEAARAGVRGRFVDHAARKVIADAGYGEYFGHSFGHGIGLDIHELPLAAPSGMEILKSGNIISAEPGIYLPGKFGVRIEDMLLITENGSENLTKAPKQLTVCG